MRPAPESRDGGGSIEGSDRLRKSDSTKGARGPRSGDARRGLPATIVLASVLTAGLVLEAAPVSAQIEREKLRFDWIGGVLMTGEIASSDFVFDTTPFGGERTERTGGYLDIDPSIWYGLETTWRHSDRISFSASWMHARSRFRVVYPALTREGGDFDLEGLILAGQDFQNAALDVEATSAMNDALVDVYLASAMYEVPMMSRWVFPYFSLGGGLYKVKSDGNIIEVKYKGDPPPAYETLEIFDIDPFAASGVPAISVDELDFMVSLGVGLRASISQRWGADLMFEDLVRLGADHSDLDSSTPDVDPDQGVFLATSFRGREGTIHNFGIRLAVNYAFWPYDRPR
jgi:hypothetical protein